MSYIFYPDSDFDRVRCEVVQVTCLYVCLFVYLPASPTAGVPYIQISPNFLYMLPAAVGRVVF